MYMPAGFWKQVSGYIHIQPHIGIHSGIHTPPHSVYTVVYTALLGLSPVVTTGSEQTLSAGRAGESYRLGEF